MLKSVTFKKEIRCFKPRDYIPFFPGGTLLVGEQGCGKSTLLQILSDSSGLSREELISSEVSEELKTTSVATKYLDFEKRNPRTTDPQMFEGSGYGTALMSRFKSHGEIVLPLLGHLTQVTEKTIFFLDEPDMALSIRSIAQVVKSFKACVKAGNQIIASAHNPLFILSFPEVYSLEHRKVMSSVNFVKSHLTPTLKKKLRNICL